ncbi:MAG: OmpP1/FadL family transporter [Pseudomonadota bacterium]
MTLNRLAFALAAAGFASGAYATNGMNLEGYGPIAHAMGGASMAYDNGNAAMMNNPATLGLVADGSNRLDLAVGFLGPDVTSKMPMMPDAESGGDAYLMPAVGWSRKTGALTYGVGMFAQGGMGTEYGKDSFVSGYRSLGYAMSNGAAGSAGMTGMEARSELGVGRVLFPVAYDLSPAFRVGGSLDFVWGGLDLAMPLSGDMFGDMMPGSTNYFGAISPTSTMLGSLNGMMQSGMVADIRYGHFDFSNGDSFNVRQKTNGTGFAGKIGFVWKASPSVQVGGTYHSKTDMSDFKGNGTMTLGVTTGTGDNMDIPVPGKLAVHDFQWPETFGLGVSFKPNDRTMIALDYKRLNWSDVMKNFHMTFTANSSAGNVGMGLANQTFEATLRQDWDDQDIFMLGVAYKTTDKLTLRGGVNLASNPIPESITNPLFPATIENHYTVGFGYEIDPSSEVNFSLAFAPEVTVQSAVTQMSIDHSQMNWQLMYSKRF